MKKTILLFVISMSLIVQVSFSQSSNNNWKYFSNGEIITDIAEGNNDIWVGTTGGLVRINKQTLQETLINRTNSGILFNKITDIYVDQNNKLWVINNDANIVVYDGQNWNKFVIPIIDSLSRSEKSVTEIDEDSQGNMYFTTSKAGLIKYDGQTFIKYTEYMAPYVPSPIPISGGNVALCIDHADNIYFSILIGLGILKNDGSWFYRSTCDANYGLPAGNIMVLYEDNDSNMWAGSQFNGVVYPSFPGGEVSWRDDNGWHFVPDPNNMISEVRDITSDNAGNIYIATISNGLLKWDGSILSYVTKNDNSIASLNTTAVHSDQLGNLWIGTTKGLYRKNGNTVEKIITSNTDLLSNRCVNFYEQKNGTINLEFAYYLRRMFDNVIHKSYVVENSKIVEKEFSDSLIKNIHYEDSLGNLWGISGARLVKYSDTVQTIYNVPSSITPQPILFYSMTWDKVNNKFWFGAQKGLYSFKNNVWAYEGNFMNYGNATQVLSVYADSTGCLWAGSVLSGVASYKNGQWTSYNQSWAMYNRTISIIEEDREHNLWFVDLYDNAIGRYDGSSWEIFNEQNSPLTWHNFKNIAFDQDNKLYVAQEYTGVLVWDGNIWDTLNIDNSLVDELNTAVYFDKNNNMWLMGYGITVYNPQGVVLDLEEVNAVGSNGLFGGLYPNPTSDIANVMVNGFIGKVAVNIYDLQGKLVKSTNKYVNNNQTIKVSTIGLKQGVYILELNNMNETRSYKLIISR